MANLTVINPYEIPKGKEAEAEAAWDTFAEYFRRQPGYISSKLCRAVKPNSRNYLVTVAEWESAEHVQAAMRNPEFREVIKGMKETFPSSPGLYEVIREL